MDSSNLLNDGIDLMLFGMGFVFLFLTLLVIVTSFMSWVITKIEKNIGAIPEDGVPSPAVFIPPHGPVATKVEDKTLISVITAAVHKYRSK
ncbi:MAG: sodium pump decarboxylase subunit gamma [Gammaproteobacteria bacterium]|nr:MAG: sodium pump decarboxylase subunit gamma [Gammaproteobacteria bacterium]